MILTLADGSKFDPVAKKIIEDKTSNSDNELEVLPIPKPKTSMRLEDLPASPKVMNATIAVVGYKLLGLPNRDICDALGCSLQQLDDILEGEIYKTTFDNVLTSFVNGQEHSARDIIAKNAMKAANQLATIMSNSKNEANRLKAAESVLNRMNITGTDNNGMGGVGLTIKIIKDTKSEDITITM